MKRIITPILVILLLILFSITAMAVSVTPSNQKIEFTPDQVKIVGYTLKNFDTEKIDLEVSLDGELSKFIKIEDSIEINSGEIAEKAFTIEMPNKLPLPGINEGKIIFTNSKTKQKTIMTVSIQGEKTGLFVNADVRSYEDLDKINMVFILNNLGTENYDKNILIQIIKDGNVYKTINDGQVIINKSKVVTFEETINKNEIGQSILSTRVIINLGEYNITKNFPIEITYAKEQQTNSVEQTKKSVFVPVVGMAVAENPQIKTEQTVITKKVDYLKIGVVLLSLMIIVLIIAILLKRKKQTDYSTEDKPRKIDNDDDEEYIDIERLSKD